METKRKNILMFVLFQTLGQTSTAIAKRQIDKDVNILDLLNNVLENANIELEKSDKKFVCEEPKQEQENIKNLDSLYNLLSTAFNFLFEVSTADEKKEILPQYNRFIDNLNNLRENMETCTNVELWKETEEIQNGTFDKENYTKYNPNTFWL